MTNRLDNDLGFGLREPNGLQADRPVHRRSAKGVVEATHGRHHAGTRSSDRGRWQGVVRVPDQQAHQGANRRHQRSRRCLRRR